MTSSARRSLALVGATAAAVLVVWVGLRPAGEGGAAPPAAREVPTLDTAADAEMAERAFRRVELFRAGGGGERLTLTASEVTALLRHSVPAMLPGGVVDPTVLLEDGRVHVSARVASDDFAARGPLTSVLGVLPDTIDVDLRGWLRSTPSRVVFYVEEARTARVPLPRGVVISVAKALAARSGEELFADDSEEPTLTLGWPSGVAYAEVVDDRLVLRRHEPIADRAVDGSDHP